MTRPFDWEGSEGHLGTSEGHLGTSLEGHLEGRFWSILRSILVNLEVNPGPYLGNLINNLKKASFGRG